MQVCLVSQDLKVRDFISEVVGSGFSSCAVDHELPLADLYVFDFDPGIGLSHSRSSGGHPLLLVHPKDLPAFGEQIGSEPVCMLLKPVGRPAFEAFFDSFRQRWASKDRIQAEQFRSDRDELLQHLLQANLRLQEYDQERTQFLARALHDLRTPLMSLRGICGLLLEGEAGPLNQQQRELLQRMQSSSGRLTRLSSGMFELSVEGRVQRTPQLEPGNIECCVQKALQEVGSQVREKQLLVVSDLQPPGAAMLIESQQVEQLLINLLENACKFTPRFGKNEISGYPVSSDSDISAPKTSVGVLNGYRIDMRDSGPGIDSAMLDTIFEQYTSTAAPNDRSGGGLGLAICRLITSAHRGRIWATSSREGGLFSVFLPFDPRAADIRFARMSEDARPRAAHVS